LRHTPWSTWSAPVTADTLLTQNGYDAEGHLVTVVAYAAPANPQGDISVSEAYGYDAYGRTVRHTRNGKLDVTTYDPAGNVKTYTPASLGTVTSVYDAANRLMTRSVPSRAYPQQHCQGLAAGLITDPVNANQCFAVFPAYPNDASNGYTIPAEQADFTYDTLGNVLTANNGDAKVSRQYFPNGALKKDSVSHRAVIGSGYDYSFALNYDYDLDGNRKTLKLPSGDLLTYAYHPELGALTSITDPRFNRYRYDYDLAGRIDSAVVGTVTVDGLREARRYDAEGRLFTHVRYSPVLGQIYSDSMTLDALGRTIRAARGTRANQSPPDTTYFTYSGLGAVLARERTDGAAHTEAEEFRVDAYGNVLSSRAGNSNTTGAADPRIASYTFRGFMTGRGTTTAPLSERETLTQSADLDGNVVASQDQIRARDSSYTLDTPTRQYYSATGQLRAVQRYRLIGAGTVNGVFEEYRYDALGRRVLVISRHGTPAAALCSPAITCAILCNTGCVESVTRAMWDGSAIVHEERRPYPNGALGAPHFNIIEYVHGVETDRPFASLDSRLSSLTRALSWTWRGLSESSTAADGSAADCSLVGGTCDLIAWQDGNAIYDRPTPTTNSAGGQTYLWAGSLLLDQQDKTGQHFRRNRYYDSQSGRFTQEDPIGLAGGMNLYGFAGGDPVTYSDPFGLCKNARGEEVYPTECDKPIVDVSAGTFAVAGGLFGIVRGAVGAGIAAIGEALSARAASRATEAVLFEGGKDALKEALSGGIEGINAQQGRALLKTLGEGSVDKIRIVTGENGLVSYSTRAGRNGYQTLARVFDESGNLRRMAQGAWDRTGQFVHGEVWK
jgi:RHS repeat-associated protein